MKLANRVAALTPSSTLAITAKAKELKSQGLDIIALGAGEPDFNTPSNILLAAQKSMEDGQTKYTPSAGLQSLRKVVADKLSKDQGLTYSTDQIFIASGAKHALYTLFQAILDEEDEVLIPTPYWVSYPEQVKLADGVPVYIDGKEENSFKVTPLQIEQAITEKTRALIINSPSNPTGMIYTAEELKAIGDVCLKHDIIIVSDEIYEKLVYHNHQHVSIAELSEELKQQTIVINGVSKSHSMTGWRIGYAAGNQAVIKAMTNLASHSTSNPTTTAQFAAIEAYTGPQDQVEVMRSAFEQRLDAIYDQLLEIPGLTCIKPQGAFYLFPNVSKTAELCGFSNIDEFAGDLLEKALVAVVPGSGFGAPDNIRLSYATSLEALEEAISRIKDYVTKKESSKAE